MKLYIICKKSIYSNISLDHLKKIDNIIIYIMKYCNKKTNDTQYYL